MNVWIYLGIYVHIHACVTNVVKQKKLQDHTKKIPVRYANEICKQSFIYVLYATVHHIMVDFMVSK